MLMTSPEGLNFPIEQSAEDQQDFFNERGLSEVAEQLVTYTTADGATHVSTVRDAANVCPPFKSQLETLSQVPNGKEVISSIATAMKPSAEQAAAYQAAHNEKKN